MLANTHGKENSSDVSDDSDGHSDEEVEGSGDPVYSGGEMKGSSDGVDGRPSVENNCPDDSADSDDGRPRVTCGMYSIVTCHCLF